MSTPNPHSDASRTTNPAADPKSGLDIKSALDHTAAGAAAGTSTGPLKNFDVRVNTYAFSPTPVQQTYMGGYWITNMDNWDRSKAFIVEQIKREIDGDLSQLEHVQQQKAGIDPFTFKMRLVINNMVAHDMIYPPGKDIEAMFECVIEALKGVSAGPVSILSATEQEEAIRAQLRKLAGMDPTEAERPAQPQLLRFSQPVYSVSAQANATAGAASHSASRHSFGGFK